MTSSAHWDRVYRDKATTATSWYRPHLEVSLRMIGEACEIPAASIIDVGGGESTLADDLLARGCRDLTIVDIAEPALVRARARLGADAQRVRWITGDITTMALPDRQYDLWHDRAAFHFLTQSEQRAAYRRALLRAVRPGGHAVISTFGPTGPDRCSGLEIVRYDAASLAAEMGDAWELQRSELATHLTSSGVEQPFVHCRFRRCQPS
ncbi:MAG: methylase involved in ubiquinone/menaquinone biosynthesis [Panacagrimonas sp.]|jgi:ubiquinone/menaquinone biosynthesis C-methylase UbiE|nr:class I SAM-dependent methyltransferase [Panacagrimonas sp.]MCC2659101.1 methylase involved in ubiquinone/menaquinone biosynthesis [Panacagrimonas sp.]